MKIGRLLKTFMAMTFCAIQMSCEEKPGVDPNRGPTNEEMLSVAKTLAGNTLAVMTGPNGKDIDVPCIDADSVTITEVSLEGATCIVRFDATINFLDGFRQGRGLALNNADPNFNGWFRVEQIADIWKGLSNGIPAHDWEAQWYATQRARRQIDFVGVKVRMRRWNTGWQYEQGPIFESK